MTTSTPPMPATPSPPGWLASSARPAPCAAGRRRAARATGTTRCTCLLAHPSRRSTRIWVPPAIRRPTCGASVRTSCCRRPRAKRSTPSSRTAVRRSSGSGGRRHPPGRHVAVHPLRRAERRPGDGRRRGGLLTPWKTCRSIANRVAPPSSASTRAAGHGRACAWATRRGWCWRSDRRRRPGASAPGGRRGLLALHRQHVGVVGGGGLCPCETPAGPFRLFRVAASPRAGARATRPPAGPAPAARWPR